MSLPHLGWEVGAVLLEILVPWQWLPENVIANPLISFFGEIKARPPLGLKGHFQSFLSVTWGGCASHISLINSSTSFGCFDCGGERK